MSSIFMDTGSTTSIGSVIPFVPYEDIVEVMTEKNKRVNKLVRYQHISFQKQYLDVSPEELRYNDYLMGRNRKVQTSIGNSLFGINYGMKFGSQAKTPTTGFQFNPPQPPNQPFNFQFSNPTTIFGTPANTLTNTGTVLFGQQTQGTGFFSQATNTATTPATGIFGQPTATTGFGTGIFGQPTTTGFGTSGVFGQTANTNTNAGTSWLNKPATSTSFGFGQSTNTSTLFGQPAKSPAFGFGTAPFGQPATTLTNSGTGFFGNQSVTTPAQNASFWNTGTTNNVAKSPFNFGPMANTPGTTTTTTPSTTPQFQWGFNNSQQQPQQQQGFQFQPFQNQNPFNQQPQQQSVFGQPANTVGFSNFQQTPNFGFATPQPQQQLIQPTLSPHQLIWNGLGIQGQVPTAFSHGRSPSIFNPDPEYNSPLYNWIVNPLSGKTLYASGLNPLLQSHLFPSSSEIPLTRIQSSRTLFKPPDPEFMNWNNVVKDNIRRAQLRNAANLVSRYRPAFKSFTFDDDFHHEGKSFGRSCLAPTSNRRYKNIDSAMVSNLEGCGRDNRYSFSNPGPKIGQRLPALSARRNNIQLNETTFLRKPPEIPSPLIGFFEQPFENPIAFNPTPPASPTRRGPPIRNDSVERININIIGGASDFEGLRGILKSPEPTVANLNMVPPVNTDSQRQNLCTRKKVQFVEGYMPSSPGDRCKSQSVLRARSAGPRPRSHSHTLKLYDAHDTIFPCRIITLTKSKYYCIPDVTTLHLMVSFSTGQCIVEDFEVGHEDFGKVVFPGILDAKGINLDNIIQFKHKEIQLYPDDVKPPYNQELNRLAIVTLAKVWPLDKSTGHLITNEDVISGMNYEDTLRRSCNRFHGNFVSYNSATGMWKFEIQLPPNGNHM